MRLILTTIILTMLVQPALAQQTRDFDGQLRTKDCNQLRLEVSDHLRWAKLATASAAGAAKMKDYGASNEFMDSYYKKIARAADFSAIYTAFCK